jgi:hypothetical protein
MAYLVRFHSAANPTMKAREDRTVERVSDYFDLTADAIGDPEVGGTSIHSVCESCGHTDLLGQLRTEKLGG